MDLTQDDVVRILELIDESPMGRVSIQVGDLKLEVAKGTGPGAAPARTAAEPPPAAAAPAEAKAAAPSRAAEQPAAQDRAAGAESGQVLARDEGLVAIKAPILGIVYRQAQPGSPPYVEVGTQVEENTTVALIEVMKLFNPVKAGVRGRIQEICVDNNQLVEFGQVLFLVGPG